MLHAIRIFTIACGSFSIICFLIFIIKYFFTMRYYKRKERPKTTTVICPITKEPLKDFELFNGRCSRCVFRNGHVAARDCESNIRTQKTIHV